MGAIAITAAASASAGTAGTFQHGMAVFTIAKGGLMYNAVVAGQKFSYHTT